MVNKLFNLFCLLITLTAVSYVYFNKNDNIIPNIERVAVIAEAKILSKKLDKNGLEHTIVEETNNVLPKNLLLSGTGYDLKFVDSLLAVTDIQKKQITSLLQINQSVQAKNLQGIMVIDSINRKKFEYRDSNLYVSYTPAIDSNKAGQFGYRFNQDLNIISYNKKKWLFGKDRMLMDISSTSKYSTINGVKKIIIPIPEKSFNLKFAAKTIYQPSNGEYGLGGTIRIKSNKVTLTGSHIYYPIAERWIPEIGVEFDLLNY